MSHSFTHSFTVDGMDSEQSGRHETGGGAEVEPGGGGVVEEDHHGPVEEQVGQVESPGTEAEHQDCQPEGLET